MGCTERARGPAERQQRAVEALQGNSWYDYENGDYRPPPVSPEFDDPMRSHGWKVPEENVLQNTPGPATGIGLAWLGEGLGVLVLVLLVVGMVAALVMLARYSAKHWDRRRLAPERLAAFEIDPARVVDLPFETADTTRDPLEMSRALAAQGDYNAAVRYLYAYMLLVLDRAAKIALHRGKTNRMYLMELDNDRSIGGWLVPVVLAFEDAYFGRRDIDQSRFASLWQALDAFHQELASSMAVQRATAAAAAPVVQSESAGPEVPRL